MGILQRSLSFVIVTMVKSWKHYIGLLCSVRVVVEVKGKPSGVSLQAFDLCQLQRVIDGRWIDGVPVSIINELPRGCSYSATRNSSEGLNMLPITITD